MTFSLLHHLFLKGFGKAVTIFVTHFGVLGADSSFPLCRNILLEPDLVSDFSLLPELYFFFCYAIIYKILPLLWFDYHKHTRFFSPWGHWANMSICLRKFFLLERLGSAVELYLGRGSCS